MHEMAAPHRLLHDAAGARPPAYSVRQRVTSDVDEHAGNLSAWGQTYDQLSPGGFRGTLTEVWSDDAQVFRETTSHLIRQSCRVWPGALWFGIPVDDTALGTVCGRRFGLDALAAHPGASDFELITPAGFDILGLVVDTAALVQHAVEVEHRDIARFHAEPVWSVGAPARARLAQFVLQALDEVGSNPGVQQHRAAQRALNQAVLAAAFELCGTVQAVDRVGMSRQRIFASVRDYVMSRADEPITVPDLCREFHVSRRTLQYCFEQVLGISPGAYLRALRLNGVRRELKNPASRFKTVQDAAAAWGFWHWSQFAVDYRKLFGERPSQTLRARWRGA